MPDYDPYTISRCRSCDIAKGDEKTRLAAFIPDNELWEACRVVRVCYSLNRTPAFNKYRKSLVEEAKNWSWSTFKSVHWTILSDKEFIQARSGACSQCRASRDVCESKWSHPRLAARALQPTRWGKRHEYPRKMWKTFKRKKHHGDTRHEAYELQYKGETWIVKMRSFKTRVKRSMPYKKKNKSVSTEAQNSSIKDHRTILCWRKNTSFPTYPQTFSLKIAHYGRKNHNHQHHLYRVDTTYWHLPDLMQDIWIYPPSHIINGKAIATAPTLRMRIYIMYTTRYYENIITTLFTPAIKASTSSRVL